MHSFGYLGECELTNLAFIDRGTSFMCDTLHSIYHGAFVCTKVFFKQIIMFTIRSNRKNDYSYGQNQKSNHGQLIVVCL